MVGRLRRHRQTWLPRSRGGSIRCRSSSTIRSGPGSRRDLVQRAQLLDAILADLYGARRLLSRRHLPPATVLDHDEYLRPLVGSGGLAGQRLFLVAADLGRDSSGQWKVISDRTQAPSGAGYAMQNRRVVSRVMPEIYREANLHRLTPVLPSDAPCPCRRGPRPSRGPARCGAEPGHALETAFDQAFVASLLGFPLLEGSDLTVRDGRVWMRVLDKLEQVDVILRRIDSTWMDSLELRPESRLGVAGLRRMRTPRHRKCAQRSRLRGTGKSRSHAIPARVVRAVSWPVTAIALGRDVVVR